MISRAARWIVWSAVTLWFTMGSIGLVLQGLTGRTTFDLGLLITISSSVSVAAWIIAGAIIVTRQPHNRIGWLLILTLFTWAPQMLSVGLIAYALHTGSSPSPGLRLATIVLASIGQPISLTGFVLLFLVYPSGRVLSRNWRIVGWATLASLPGYVLLAPLRPDVLDPGIGLTSPFALSPSEWARVAPAHLLSIGIALISLFAALVSLFLRFRKSIGVERQQMKWFAYSAIPVIATFVVAGFVNAEVVSPFLLLSVVAFVVSLMGIPVAVAVSILRYRLYDIDLIINRTLVYGGLTGALASVYFVSVAVLESLVRGLAGQESQIAVVGSTLLVAVSFQPLRRRLQAFIDQRFYRSKYDAEKALARFGEALRDEVDPETISRNLQSVVSETLQPESISLWLRTLP